MDCAFGFSFGVSAADIDGMIQVSEDGVLSVTDLTLLKAKLLV